jgi:hypothetical protein
MPTSPINWRRLRNISLATIEKNKAFISLSCINGKRYTMINQVELTMMNSVSYTRKFMITYKTRIIITCITL